MRERRTILIIGLCILMAGILTGPTSVFGQCRIEVVAQNDSTIVFKTQTFKGVALTRNRTQGVRTNIVVQKEDMTTLNNAELPESARIIRPSLQDICSFENSFRDWWSFSPNRSRINYRGLTIEQEEIYRFNRQYILYTYDSKKYIRAVLFRPQMYSEEDWKTKPVTCGHCWPDIVVLNYDVDSRRVTLDVNFK